MTEVFIAVFLITLLIAEVVFFAKLPDIQKKYRNKKMKEQGIENRFVVKNYHFGLFKIVDNEKY